MHGLQALLAFSETAKRGGFAAAARKLGSTPSTVAKAVGRLEASLDVRLSDAYADLVKDGIDVAIRAGEFDDSTLVARRFASQQLILVAAPSDLREHGTPRTLDALAGHRHILFRLPGRGRDRPQQFSADGRIVVLRPAEGSRFNDGEAMVQAAALGLGLTQVPDYMAAEEIAAGRLVEVLLRHRPPPMPIHAVMPGHRMVPRRVRVLLDALGRLSGAPPRGRGNPCARRQPPG